MSMKMSPKGSTRFLRTPDLHGYSIKFSPYRGSLLGIAGGQNFGLSGCGSLALLDLGLPGNGLVRSFSWNNCLFDLTWSEQRPQCVVTAAGDGSLQMWDTQHPEPMQELYKEHLREVSSVEWSQTRNEELFVSSSWDTTLKVWNPNYRTSQVTMAGHDALIYHATWSPHLPGCVASASGDGTLRIWNIRRPQAGPSLVVVAGDGSEVICCDWSKYNQNLIVTSTTDCSINGWDLRQPMQPLFMLKGHQYPARRIKCSPFQETRVASVSYDFSTRLWDYSLPYPCIMATEQHKEFVSGIDMSNHTENMIADCAWDQTVCVYSLGKLRSDSQDLELRQPVSDFPIGEVEDQGRVESVSEGAQRVEQGGFELFNEGVEAVEHRNTDLFYGGEIVDPENLSLPYGGAIEVPVHFDYPNEGEVEEQGNLDCLLYGGEMNDQSCELSNRVIDGQESCCKIYEER